MLILIAVLSFLAVSLATVDFMRPRQDPVARRISRNDPVAEGRPSRLEGGLRQRVVGPSLRRTGGLFARLLPAHWIRAVDRERISAAEPWSLTGFLAVWFVAIVGGIALASYTVAALNLTGASGIMVSAFIAGVAGLLPYIRLRTLAKQRRKAITRALPDAIDLLVTSVEAGLGVDAAFALVTEKSSGPLAETFALYLRQVGLGRGRQEALLDIARRTGVPDLLTIANNVNQGEELGTPLGDVLRTQAEELRLLRRQRAEVAAQRAPVLMTIPMALCFLPAMGAVVVVPSVLNLFRFVGNLGGG